jgi:predicted enzyme related to lactoylglutathione lyase
MDRVVHFELNVSDPERTEAFFTQVFGIYHPDPQAG